MNKLTILVFISTLICFSAKAQDENLKESIIPTGKIFESVQKVTINKKTINLQTEAGTHQLRDENDKPIALFGYTSYIDQEGEKDRPIVFAFNGGPLSASFWLHMGVLGPKRIVINDPDFTKGAPYQIVNNEYSILDVADLVMIDPVGVGFSRPIGDAKFKDFWGVDQDIRSIGLFIEQFLIKKGRINSPKFLLGESYGTFRNAGLMYYLQNKGIAMNGVIMVSAVFDFHHITFGAGDDVAYMIHFPTYCAAAWYHNKIDNKSESLESYLDEVREFTQNEYAPALLKGDQLSDTEKMEMAQKLARLSGLSQDYWYKADLRVTNREFFQEFLREKGETVGRLDSRFTGINQDLLAQSSRNDPVNNAITPPFIAAFKNYLYEDLGVDRNLTYTTSAYSREGFKWDWKRSSDGFMSAQTVISTSGDMATAMSQNPNLKVLILNGYYDLATVFYGVEHSINHMGLQPQIKKNIIMKYYEAGHMMYTHEPSIIKFKKDVDEFILSSSGK